MIAPPNKNKEIKKVSLKKAIKKNQSRIMKSDVLEGRLELCRLEALWLRAKAPLLTPRWGEEGWTDDTSTEEKKST